MPEVATSEGPGQQIHQTQGQSWERDQRHSQSWDQSHGQQSHQRQSQNWEQDQRHGQSWEQAPRTSAASTPRKAVPPNVAFQISKSLSTILRHKAQQLGLTVRPDGFCVVDEVLNLNMMKSLHATQEALEQVTNSNEKKRFEMSIIDGRHMIRAVQGHSMKSVSDSELLQPLDLNGRLPEKCVHGTYFRHWTSIASKGLLAGGLGDKGQRNHIHFAPYDYSDKRVISGMRAGCDIAIYVDLRKAMMAGIQFFLSKNEVILTQGEN